MAEDGLKSSGLMLLNYYLPAEIGSYNRYTYVSADEAYS